MNAAFSRSPRARPLFGLCQVRSSVGLPYRLRVFYDILEGVSYTLSLITLGLLVCSARGIRETCMRSARSCR